MLFTSENQSGVKYSSRIMDLPRKGKRLPFVSRNLVAAVNHIQT
ncbi:hypothetical protein VCRA2113O415_180037 [Vibrio crassostreae]|nr:hypothetical protein VCRA2113O415_180037 [Vibrio crassostreae]CAK2593221.1 hypothetical protein VCRA2113O420_170056 [Vibrio crassostreae]CAK3212927.1 hypothetical protein VCRA2121O436_180057 [Vibrio crassostreae]